MLVCSLFMCGDASRTVWDQTYFFVGGDLCPGSGLGFNLLLSLPSDSNSCQGCRLLTPGCASHITVHACCHSPVQSLVCHIAAVRARRQFSLPCLGMNTSNITVHACGRSSLHSLCLNTGSRGADGTLDIIPETSSTHRQGQQIGDDVSSGTTNDNDPNNSRGAAEGLDSFSPPFRERGGAIKGTAQQGSPGPPDRGDSPPAGAVASETTSDGAEPSAEKGQRSSVTGAARQCSSANSSP